MNFAVVQVTPVMLTNIGYETFIVCMCFCVLGLVWVYFVMPKLKGLSLEEIDGVFADEIWTQDRFCRERIADELGLHTMVNVAADGVVVDSRAGLPSKQEIEMMEG